MIYRHNQPYQATMRKKDKVQLIIIWSAALMAGLLTWFMFYQWTRPVHGLQNSILCPTPSFDAGGFCRTVTGCPYGDSIPLDSPKCAPPPELSPALSPAVENFEGK